jgi:hypothetical protein
MRAGFIAAEGLRMKPMIVEVPSPIGIDRLALEHAPDVLRLAGLQDRLGDSSTVRLDIPPTTTQRGTQRQVFPLDGSLSKPVSQEES